MTRTTIEAVRYATNVVRCDFSLCVCALGFKLMAWFLQLILCVRYFELYHIIFQLMELIMSESLKPFPKKTLLLLSAILTVLAASSAVAKEASVDDQEKAKNALAAKRNEPAQHFKVVGSAEFDGIKSFKILDHKTKEIQEINLDSKNREIPDKEMAKILDARAKRGFQGKLTDELANKKKGSPMEMVDVLVWTTMDQPLPQYDWERAHQQGKKAVEELEQFANAVSIGTHKRATNPLLEFASKQGWEVGYQAEHAPILKIRLPAGQLSVLESRKDVSLAFLERRFVPTNLAISTSAIGANTLWTNNITGAGIKVGVVEVPATANGAMEGAGVYFNHIALNDGTSSGNTNTLNNTFNLNPAIRIPDPSNNVGMIDIPIPIVGGHATFVAGIIAKQSTDTNSTATIASTKGIAYGVLNNLLSANSSGEDSNIIEATEWTINNNAKILNFSIGDPRYSNNPILNNLDRYLDYLVRNKRVTVVVAAGNQTRENHPETCNAPNWTVSTPGRGWNVITVGSYDSHGTVSNSDDTMSDTSCYGDPSSTFSDREKPEIAAPGVDIISTTANCSGNACYAIGTGTSFAAPHVSGCAALLMQHNTNLQTAPEVLKAALMASAISNIEGNSALSALSEQDGAGGLECDIANNIINNISGGVKSEPISSTSMIPWYTFNALQGQTVRAAIAWSSRTNSSWSISNNTDSLGADFDLRVQGPMIPVDGDGHWCGGCHHETMVTNELYPVGFWISASHDNSYEVVEFQAPVTGTYSISISKRYFSTGSENLGIAWWTGTK